MIYKNLGLLCRVGLIIGSLLFVGIGQLSAELTQSQYFKASNTGDSDAFGTGGTLEGDAVALSKDGATLAIGATYEGSNATGIDGDQTDDSLYGAGAVYVFVQRDDDWVQQAYVKASNSDLVDAFGYMVALSTDGNTMAVSAHFEASGDTGVNAEQADNSIPEAGAVYVFVRNQGHWQQQAYLKASNAGELSKGDEYADGDQFGSAITLSDDGNTLAISAVTEDGGTSGVNGDQTDNSMQSSGAVYIFNRDGSAWRQTAYLKASNPGAGDMFGYAISFSADAQRLVVSSFDEDGSLAGTNEQQDDETNGSGAIYIFDFIENSWRQTAYLKASNSERNDAMGVAVAMSDDGNTIVAGALDEDGLSTGVNNIPGSDWEVNQSTGAVYVYVYAANAWHQQAYIKASNTGPNDIFGSRLALSGDGETLAIGAQLEDSAAQGIDGMQDDDSASEAGAVYLFARVGDSWSQIHYVKGSNTEAFDEFGSSISLNRDGSLMAVGAQYEDSSVTGVGGDQSDNSSFDSGAVYLFSR